MAESDPAAPERLGRYVLMDSLGEGGMGQIFRARAYGAAGAVKELCVKRIRQERLGDAGATERFIDEARVSMRLTHANVVAVFDFGRTGDDGYYLAMEWVDGADLRSILARHAPLSPIAAAHVGAEIARALAYAHGEGVVHRDVKPGNVLVSRSGDVKLTDFGVAQVRGEAEAVGGTPAYMAPEQGADDGAPVDGRADLYALGVLLVELFTGERPRPGAPYADGDPGRVPEALRSLLSSLLAEAPGDRPGGAAEVAGVLERWVGGAWAEAGGAGPRAELGSLAALARPRGAAPTGGGATAGHAAELPTETLAAVGPGAGAPGRRIAPGSRSGTARGTGPGATPGGTPGATPGIASGERTPAADGPRRPRRRTVVAGGLALAALVGLAAWGLVPGEERPSGPASAPPPAGAGAAASAAATPATPSDATGAREPGAPGASDPGAGAGGRATGALGDGTDEEAPAAAVPPGGADGARTAARVRDRSGPRAAGRGTPRSGPGPEDPAASPGAEPPGGAAGAGAGPSATLNVNAIPWAEVRVDGRPVGTTPLFGLSLPPGPHAIDVENPSLGVQRRTRVVLEPGERRDVVLDLR